MSKNLNPFFSTGEFAKICHVTKHTLFHYDEIGVFSPELVGENGYRYYSPAQYEMFSVIAILRELGMPLEEIKEYLDKRSPQKLLQLLCRQEKAINEKMRELNAMKQLIAEKYEVTQQACQANEEAIAIKWEKQEIFLCSSTFGETDDRSFAENAAALVNQCIEQGLHIHHTQGGLRRSEDMRAGQYEKYDCFYVKVLEEQSDIPQITKEAGNYLVAYHRGDFESMGETYQKLFTYAETNHICLAEWIFEETMLDQLSIRKENEYLLKLSVKVLGKEEGKS